MLPPFVEVPPPLAEVPPEVELPLFEFEPDELLELLDDPEPLELPELFEPEGLLEDPLELVVLPGFAAEVPLPLVPLLGEAELVEPEVPVPADVPTPGDGVVAVVLPPPTGVPAEIAPPPKLFT